MAIITGVCWSFKLEVLNGVHNMSADTLMVALLDPAANVNPSILTAYNAGIEALGTGYPPGGYPIALSPGSPALTALGVAEARYATVVTGVITVTYGGLLIYNASKGNRAIEVIQRPTPVTVTVGPLALQFPPTSPALVSIV